MLEVAITETPGIDPGPELITHDFYVTIMEMRSITSVHPFSRVSLSALFSCIV